MDIFQRLKDERGITIVLITHEPQVAEYGSRIIRFKDGRVVVGSARTHRGAPRPRSSRRSRSGRPGRRCNMSTRSSLTIALRALRRNRLQTSLTIVGMTIGVAAVLTMIAIGTGAEAAIEDQIRAAGMNLIVVTAGNYKVKATDDFGGGAVEPSAALRRRPLDRDDREHVPRPTALRYTLSRSVSRPMSCRRRCSRTRKTIRWRSTITRRRSSGSATARPASDRRRR